MPLANSFYASPPPFTSLLSTASPPSMEDVSMLFASSPARTPPDGKDCSDCRYKSNRLRLNSVPLIMIVVPLGVIR